MNTLPDAGMSKVIGLLEVLHDDGNEAETVKISEHLQLDVENLLPVIEAAELLGFILVSGGKLKLTDSGLKLVNGKIIERRAIIREKLSVLEPFKRVTELMKSKKSGRVAKKALQKVFRQELPKDQADKVVARIIEWGRHAAFIGYESDSDELYLANYPKP